MRSLYWFRSDLRIADNLALADAIRYSDSLMAVFIVTPETWRSHGAAPCKIQFLLDNVRLLSENLWRHGIPLLIRQCPSFSDCSDVLARLCDQHSINAMYFNYEYPLDERRRDEAVIKQLAGDVTVHSYDGHLILPPGSVLTRQNAPFQIFTPFKKAWLKKAYEQQTWRPYGVIRKSFVASIEPDPTPDSIAGFTDHRITIQWPAGEKAAQKRLRTFCQSAIMRYQHDRDYPSIDGTSTLSPYLTQGVLSARQCIASALSACGLEDLNTLEQNQGAENWISELIWREFYHHIVHFNPSISRHKPLRLHTDKLPWGNNETLLDRWKKGMTGFPIVDAGMRQLLQTGWMHNRLRMITAMFLSKILLIDWRLGEAHFMAHLIDGDFAANNGGWQWCASTGTDAVPYFRIFNPITQSKRFDPEGIFIKRFCPELERLDGKSIHAPFSSGISSDGLDYPQPMVDYKKMRSRTLELFKKLSS